jgi:NADPH:quinone reductase-like Zn-dependent oxidoreductase
VTAVEDRRPRGRHLHAELDRRAAHADKSRGALGGDIDGMLAEYVVLKETGWWPSPSTSAFRKPQRCPAPPLRRGTLGSRRLKPGGTVLIQGTGGVAIFALQLARLRGARVLGISSSYEKLERAYSLGLDAGLNYKESPEWDRWAVDETGGEGVDLVVEVGGLATLPRTLRALRIGGAIAQVGVLTGATDPTAFPIASILHKQINMQGIYVGSRKDFEELNKAITWPSCGRWARTSTGRRPARRWPAWKKERTSASWC